MQLLSQDLSRKFKFWSFISMVLLVFVHGYNLDIRYLQPWTMPGEPLTLTGFTEYFLANGIFRFRIPMLFIISGFLYALHDHKPYRQRTGKRFRTLFVPYLIWSAIGLLFTFLLELLPWGRDMVAQSHVAQMDDTRLLVHDYHWYDLLIRWIIAPVPYQLWFLRVLFIYNLAYPGIRWCVNHRIARYFFFAIAFLMWLGTMGFGLVEGEGLLFFSLGIWIQKKGFNIEKAGKWLKPLWWGIVFVTVAAVKTWLAFNGQAWLGNANGYVMSFMHKIVVISGLIACWYGLDPVVKWCMQKSWFVWLSAFSFMIYAMHTPVIAFAIDPVFSILSGLPFYRMLTFFLLPALIISLTVAISTLMRSLTPKMYGLLTGGRGF